MGFSQVAFLVPKLAPDSAPPPARDPKANP